MLAVGPAMDGEFPQHEPPPAGSILYSPPPLQTPLCGSSVQNAVLHYPWWSTFSPTPYPAFSSESHQFMSSTSFIASQPCTDTSYGPSTTTPSFLPKTGDFPQRPFEECNPPKPKKEIRAVSFWGGIGWTLSGKCLMARISRQARKTRRPKEMVCGKEPGWDLRLGPAAA